MPSELFQTIAATYAETQNDHSDDAVIAFPTDHDDALGQALFGALNTGGTCTLLVTGRRPWDPTSAPFEAARDAARRGCTIERLFLLPSRHLRHDETLRAHLTLDAEAGITTRVLDVGRVISGLDLPAGASLEFGVWDDAVSCHAVYGTGAAAGAVDHWHVSSHAADVKSFARLADALKTQGEEFDPFATPEPGTVAAIEEPVVESAMLARLVAPGLCYADAHTEYDCSALHAYWQMFRLFDVVPTPQRNPEFFLDAFAQFARQGDLGRVFVSGTCDYAILANLLHAYRSENAAIDITVSDLCETPLFLCKWYAKRVGQPIRTFAADILDVPTDQPYDVVTTHSFLYNFSPEVRRRVVTKWFDLLRPGGRLATSARMSTDQAHQVMTWEPDQRAAFRRRITEEARHWQGVLGLDPDDAANDADRYTGRLGGRYTLGGRDDFAALFEQAGFRIDHLELVEWGGNVSAKETGPGTNRKATYAEIIATRP